MGEILLVILLTLILKKLALYLEALAITKCADDQVKLHKQGKNIDQQPSRKICSLCCNGVIIRTYALEELKMATSDFRIRIGVGATSFVYLTVLGDGRFGAVKRVMEERVVARTSSWMKFLFCLEFLIQIWWDCWVSAWKK
ncbi:hypothetical protein CRYUN_Cryun12cG0003100 [Craigia yunnanensis]